MKKFLYFIPLLVLFLIPNFVYASDYPPTHVFYQDSGLTKEQKKEYADLVLNSEIFTTNISTYSYYTIYYLNSKFSVVTTPYISPSNGLLLLTFYSSNKTPSFSSSEISVGGSSLAYIYNFSTSEWTQVTISNGTVNIISFKRASKGKDYFYRLEFYQDFILSSNLDISFEFNLDSYDLNNNHLGIFPEGTNIFAPFEFESNSSNDGSNGSLDDILESENILYNLSQELIGPLPVEFHFIYSIVTLLLGVVMILVVISPFVILKRWLM